MLLQAASNENAVCLAPIPTRWVLSLVPGGARAGDGWYLLRPPVTRQDENWLPAGTALLGQWEHGGAYDTAAECESARDRWQANARREVAGAGPPLPVDAPISERSLRELTFTIHAAIAVDARCVASDDPRLT